MIYPHCGVCIVIQLSCCLATKLMRDEVGDVWSVLRSSEITEVQSLSPGNQCL